MPTAITFGSIAARAFGFLGRVLRKDEYFKYVTLLLPGNGTNGAQNNTFLDSSTNNFTITRNGNTTQGTFSPYGSNWSNYFDGTGDYLTVGSATALNLGSGDFTIEIWWYPTAFSTDDALVMMGSSAGSFCFALYNNTTGGGVIALAGTGGGSWDILSGLTMGTAVANQWNHVALVRSGTTFSTYMNGVRGGTQTSSSALGVANLGIGANSSGGSMLSAGYLSNLRILKGTALYSGATITVPTSPLTAITNTSLLTCQSNRFIDNSTNAFTITRNGDVSVQRFSPFSPTAPYAASTDGGSGYFDGTGDYLTAPSNSAFNFTGDATVECWIYPTALTNNSQLFGFNDGLSDLKWIGVLLSTSGTLSGAATAGAGGSYSSASGVVKTGFWQHIAWVKNGATVYVYVNGIQVASTASSNAYAYQASPLIIGRVDGNNSLCFNGYIADLRVVKGTAVYTSAFTPPTSPLTAITNTSLLLNFTNAGIIDNAEMNNLETVGNAQISTTQSKFGGASMYFDGNGDNLFLRSNQDLNCGTGDFTVEAWVYISSRTLNYPAIISNNNGSYSAGAIALTNSNADNAAYNDKFVLAVNSIATPTLVASATNALNTWYHLAVVRNGTSLVMYRNGVSVASTTISAAATFDWGKGGTVVGGGNWDGAQSYFNGYIDDLRITKGYARYTTSFTAPTAPFPLS